MSRILIQVLLPLLLPTIIFLVWRAIGQRLQPNETLTVSDLAEGPWGWLIIGGLALSVATLVASALLGERIPQGEFVPPRVIDGKIEPAHRVPANRVPANRVPAE